MNAAQQMVLAAALADAMEKAGIAIDRPVVQRGNVKAWERVDTGAAAARTIGLWLSWGWSASASPIVAVASAPPSADPAQNRLRLVSNNDDEDDGA